MMAIVRRERATSCPYASPASGPTKVITIIIIAIIIVTIIVIVIVIVVIKLSRRIINDRTMF